jgi:catechol 2,3-dioxygenase-like lactoylglutathione lyase family enzyme
VGSVKLNERPDRNTSLTLECHNEYRKHAQDNDRARDRELIWPNFSERYDIKSLDARAGGRGIPTARSVDHVGITVPNLDEAVEFFTSVLGCDLLYSTRRVFDSTGGDWMSRHYGVNSAAGLRTAMLRCGPFSNFELLAWDIPHSPASASEQTGVLAGHVAIYANDLREAAAYLASHPGVHILGSPTIVAGEPNEGTEFVFVRLPWGMCLELVTWPPVMPYCNMTHNRLFEPAAYWGQQRAQGDNPHDP